MFNRAFWRAVFDHERGSFVVEQAGWLDGQPVIEYHLSYLEDDDTTGAVGVLAKRWLDSVHLPTGEHFYFDYYPDEQAFQADVQHILAEAKQRSRRDNLDYFLAVTDVIKERAVDAKLEDEAIFDVEGLFETGPEDAYTAREVGLERPDRLHDHIQPDKDECWRIHVGRVVDPSDKPLGWAVFVAVYPDLTSSATDEDIAAATQVELLDLGHCPEKSSAGLTAGVIRHFMRYGDRVQDPQFAYVNDSLMFEFMSIQCSIEKIAIPAWEVLKEIPLPSFAANEYRLVREQARWHPHHIDPAADYARVTGLPVHLVDQLYAQSLDILQLTEPFPDNSPWRYLNDRSDNEAEA